MLRSPHTPAPRKASRVLNDGCYRQPVERDLFVATSRVRSVSDSRREEGRDLVCVRYCTSWLVAVQFVGRCVFHAVYMVLSEFRCTAGPADIARVRLELPRS